MSASAQARVLTPVPVDVERAKAGDIFPYPWPYDVLPAGNRVVVTHIGEQLLSNLDAANAVKVVKELLSWTDVFPCRKFGQTPVGGILISFPLTKEFRISPPSKAFVLAKAFEFVALTEGLHLDLRLHNLEQGVSREQLRLNTAIGTRLKVDFVFDSNIIVDNILAALNRVALKRYGLRFRDDEDNNTSAQWALDWGTVYRRPVHDAEIDEVLTLRANDGELSPLRYTLSVQHEQF